MKQCPVTVQLSDAVPRHDHLQRETRNPFDFIGPLDWISVATDRIVGLSPKVDRGLYNDEQVGLYQSVLLGWPKQLV